MFDLVLFALHAQKKPLHTEEFILDEICCKNGHFEEMPL